MKITVLAYPNGDILVTKPSLDENLEATLGTPQKTIRVGKIILDNNLYKTEFQLEALSSYNRGGFHSRDEAIAYEQGILDAHLAEICVF